MADNERLQRVIAVWEKTVDVQMHFNDIQMKIRNVSFAFLAATIAAVGFLLRENITVNVAGKDLHVATLLLIGALLIWFGFYYMDRFWYHRLLLGAVYHGSDIEKTYQYSLPEIGLATRIGKESPSRIGKFEIHSHTKLDICYGLIASVLIGFAVVLAVFTEIPDSSASGQQEGPATPSQNIELEPEKKTETPDNTTSGQPENSAIPGQSIEMEPDRMPED
jgi:hypothetical protein